MKQRRVIIIGGGIGGLASACLLSKQGYEVDVFEKTKEVGGKAALLALPHAFSRPFHLFFTRMHEPVEKYIRISPCDAGKLNSLFVNPYRLSYLYKNYDSPWDVIKPHVALRLLTELIFPKEPGHAYTVRNLVPALISLAKKKRVRIRTNTPVAHIRVSHERVVGVTTAQGVQYDSDIIISDADYQYTETELLSIQDRQYSQRFWAKRHYSPSAFVLQMQLNSFAETIPQEGVITTLRGNVLYLHREENRLIAVMPVPTGVSYRAQKQTAMRREIIQTIERSFSLHNLRNSIITARCFTYQGAIAGLRPTFFQSGLWRLNLDSRKVDYLYFVNSSDSLISPLLVCNSIKTLT